MIKNDLIFRGNIMSHYYNYPIYQAEPMRHPTSTPALAHPQVHTNVSGDGAINLDNLLLNPKDCIVLFIDHEPQMYLGVRNTKPETVRSNAVGLAKACRVFNVPTILTTVDEKSFSGVTVKPLREALGNPTSIDRTFINAWQDKNIVSAVKASNRKKIIISALWTELCGLMPAISAKAAGYDIYYVTDASGGASVDAHNMAVQRMIMHGIEPVTWEQVMLEWQRDWARLDTAGEVLKVANENGGSYGIGIEYHDQIAKGQVVPKVEMAP